MQTYNIQNSNKNVDIFSVKMIFVIEECLNIIHINNAYLNRPIQIKINLI
jgi:hypothetical protein